MEPALQRDRTPYDSSAIASSRSETLAHTPRFGHRCGRPGSRSGIHRHPQSRRLRPLRAPRCPGRRQPGDHDRCGRAGRWLGFPAGRFLQDRLEAKKVAINVASYAGFGTIRLEVMGDDFRRPATPEEVERMRALHARGDARGRARPGDRASNTIRASTPRREEVVALASEAAAFGGRYISHVRSEDRWFWDAIGEIIEIGRETEMPVQISHIKLALRRELGRGESPDRDPRRGAGSRASTSRRTSTPTRTGSRHSP